MSLYQQTYNVLDEHSAQHWGSGGLAVLSTPAMIAFMENAAYLYCQAQLPESDTTVGTAIATQHLAATKIGSTIQVHLTQIQHDGKQYHFDIEVYDDNVLIGKGSHTRATVNIDRFMNRLK